MKKIWILLGLLVVALFVVSCAPKESGEEGALAGQAILMCSDSDSGEYPAIKGTVTSTQYPKGITDYCKTTLGQGKTHLVEGICNAKKKYQGVLKPCAVVLGEGYICQDGACVKVAAQESNCADGLDDDSDAKTDCADSDCLGKTNAKGFTCCPGEGACPADTQCDNGGYYGSYQCLGCLADEWDCPVGKECKEGACVAKTCTPNCAGKTCGDDGCGGSCGTCPTGQDCQANGICKAQTCTPGPTGKIKCVTDSKGYTYSVKEFQNADCSKYDANNNPDKQTCGYKDSSSCKEDVGCCKSKLAPTCNGNIWINNSKNPCTGEITIGPGSDCSKYTSSVFGNGKPMVCVEGQVEGQAFCAEQCTPGEVIIQCVVYGTNGYYYKQTCNSNGIHYKTEEVASCPTGTTCQSGICK